MILSQLEQLVTRRGLEAWYASSDLPALYAEFEEILDWPDKSIHGRQISSTFLPPTLLLDVINGQPAVNFSGISRSFQWTGSLNIKHIFAVAAYEDAIFPAVDGDNDYPGLVSGLDDTNLGILAGMPETTRFYDFDYEAAGTYEYRRRDLQFAENNQQASFNNEISIFEVSLSTGWGLDGIQLGRDREHNDRRWKGNVAEFLFFSNVLSYNERHDIYAYLAMKYWLWRRVSSGLDVWPFRPEWGQPSPIDKAVLTSRSVSGAFKGRSKGTRKIGVQPQFDARCPEEYDAAVEFCDSKYPGTSFIYRDDAYSPARETEMLFLSEIQQQAQNYRDINYTFQAQQV